MEERAILKMEHVSYHYPLKAETVEILEDASVSFEKGKLYTIMGPSGSGKTTTLMLLSGLDKPKKGSVLFDGVDIEEIGAQKYRSKHSSIVFQAYNLFPYLTARENVEVSMEITKNLSNKKERAAQLLEEVGLTEEKHNKLVGKLSGGEQQRVAVARALAMDTDILLADEPTGNLDEENAAMIQEIFRRVAHKMGKCVIVVSHSGEFAKKADVVLLLRNRTFVDKD